MIKTQGRAASPASPPPVTPEFIRDRMARKMIELEAGGTIVDSAALSRAGFTNGEIAAHWEAARDIAIEIQRGDA